MRNNLSIKTFLDSLGFWAIWMIVLTVNILLIPVILLGLSLLFQEDLLSLFAFSIGNGPNPLFLIVGFIYGLLAGINQWIVLRRRINQAGGWVWATLFGTVLGWILASIIPIPREWASNIYVLLFPAAVSAAFSSIAQWFVIRKEVNRSYIWIPLSILGWSCIVFFGIFSNIAGLHNFILPAAIFGCMLLATTAVYLFSRSEQRNFNSLILGGISLLFVISWGIPAKITFQKLNQQMISIQFQQDLIGFIDSVAFSPDGTRIAATFASLSATKDFPIKVWETNSGKELFSIPTKTSFYQIGFSPDGSLLASVDRHLKVTLWDANSGAFIRKVPVSSGVPKYLAFSPDGKFLAVGNKSDDGMVTVWDIPNNKLFSRLSGSGAINCLAINPAGELLVSRADTIEIWDISRREIIHETPKANPLSRLTDYSAFSPDGKYLVEAGRLTSEKTWKAFILDVKSGEVVQTLDLEKDKTVAFSPDGKILAIGGTLEGGIRLFDTSTWQVIKTLHGGGTVSSLAFSSASNLLAAGAWVGYIRVFEIQ